MTIVKLSVIDIFNLHFIVVKYVVLCQTTKEEQHLYPFSTMAEALGDINKLPIHLIRDFLLLNTEPFSMANCIKLRRLALCSFTEQPYTHQSFWMHRCQDITLLFDKLSF